MKNMKRAPAKARHPLTFSSSVGSRHKSNNGACVQCDLRREREGAYANTMSVSGRNAFFVVFLFLLSKAMNLFFFFPCCDEQLFGEFNKICAVTVIESNAINIICEEMSLGNELQ